MAQWWASTLPPRRCGTGEVALMFLGMALWTVASVPALLLLSSFALARAFGRQAG